MQASGWGRDDKESSERPSKKCHGGSEKMHYFDGRRFSRGQWRKWLKKIRDCYVWIGNRDNPALERVMLSSVFLFTAIGSRETYHTTIFRPRGPGPSRERRPVTSQRNGTQYQPRTDEEDDPNETVMKGEEGNGKVLQKWSEYHSNKSGIVQNYWPMWQRMTICCPSLIFQRQQP